MEENDKNYISLLEASKCCAYSEPYLRLRARQGKLKSIKLGKKWMTTAAWIDDYQNRVQEWRDQSEAKRNIAREAALVNAPAALESNLEIIQAPSAPRAADETVVFADVVDNQPSVAVFCADKSPILLPPRPKRLASFSSSGQIYPVPKETKVDNVAGFGWFGALLSGALCALAVFMAVNQVNVPNADIGRMGQANASQGMLAADPPQVFSFKFLQGDSLKELVDLISSFFDGK